MYVVQLKHDCEILLVYSITVTTMNIPVITYKYASPFCQGHSHCTHPVVGLG